MNHLVFRAVDQLSDHFSAQKVELEFENLNLRTFRISTSVLGVFESIQYHLEKICKIPLYRFLTTTTTD